MRYYWHAIIACFAQSVWLASAVDLSRLLRRTTGIPSPISVPPSNNWDGDDGPWSTFSIRVGTPPQTLRVLVSTAGEITWTVLPLGCNANDISCTTNRGETFNSNVSSTWHGHDSYFSMTIEHNLNYIGYGPVGNDTLSLGSGGPTLTNQAIGGLVATDFYLGMLGLNPRPTNSTTGGEGPASLISSLKAQNITPSVAFGYTAGNQYRLNAVFGSLTLGGYDQSRFTPNNLSFNFAENNYRDLMVGIQAISSEQTPDLLPDGGILAYVDSTVPHIWLPLTACQAFEKAFGLTYDDAKERYFVNSTTHSNLKARNASITFTLGISQSGGDSINITLPYGSFDLIASWPESNDTSNEFYFPLRRAANVTQYTLGRTFLQEAYLIIDWERKNFSISQCVFDDNVSTNKQQLVAILPTDAVKVPNPSSAPVKSSSTRTGEIAGIVVGVIVVLALIGGFAKFKLNKRKNRAPAPLTTPPPSPPPNPLMSNQNEHSKGELATGREHERYELGHELPSKSPSAAWMRIEKPRDVDGGTQVFGVKDNSPGMPELASSDQSITMPPRPTVHEMESPSLRPVELAADVESPKQLYGSEDQASEIHHTAPSPPYRSATQSPVQRSMGPSPLSQPSESPPTMHSVAARPGLHSRTSTLNSLPSAVYPGGFPPPHRSASASSQPVSPLAGTGAGPEQGLGISSVLGGGEQAGKGEVSRTGLETGDGVAGVTKEGGDGSILPRGGGGMI